MRGRQIKARQLGKSSSPLLAQNPPKKTKEKSSIRKSDDYNTRKEKIWESFSLTDTLAARRHDRRESE